jgi:hypothetical protein
MHELEQLCIISFTYKTHWVTTGLTRQFRSHVLDSYLAGTVLHWQSPNREYLH